MTVTHRREQGGPSVVSDRQQTDRPHHTDQP
jgi:hypothetical protein